MKNHSAVSQYLVISALGEDRAGMANDLAFHILENGGNIVNSRMTLLHNHFAMIILVSGPWNALAKLESQLPSLAQTLGLDILSKRTDHRPDDLPHLPYLVEIIAVDQTGLVYRVTEFFASRKINITNMDTLLSAAAHTGTPLFSMNILLQIPADMHIAQLREEFMDFCDLQNIDGLLEPQKN
jgi:glycine cleavage system transcriptional repressor